MHGKIDLREQQIDIFAPPLRQIHRLTLLDRRGIGLILRVIEVFDVGGVEVIVKLDAVHRVVLHDLPHTVDDELTRPLVRRVEDDTALGLDAERRVFDIGIVVAELRGRLIDRHAVGIDPRVQPQTALLTDRAHDPQRVIAETLALFARENVRGGEELGLIERVAERAHLHDQRVEAADLAVLGDGFEFSAESRFTLVALIFHAQLHIGHPDPAHIVARFVGRAVGCLRDGCSRVRCGGLLLRPRGGDADDQHGSQHQRGDQYGERFAFFQFHHPRSVL